MRGAVAAGHPLTAAAGARVLEEGGNAVDACVAAAFAAWVTESPLTGPGAGGFALVVPSDGRPARVADFFVATPGRGRPDADEGGDARDRRRVRRRQRDDAGVPDRRGLVCRPGRGRRARGRPPRLRAAALADPARAGDRARAGGGRALTRAGPSARDPRPDPAPHERGPAGLQPADGSRLGPGDVLRAARPGRARSSELADGRGCGDLPRRARTRRSWRPSQRRRRDHRPTTSRTYRVAWRRPVRDRLPRPRGDLESAAVVGRHPDRLRPGAARAGRAGRCGQRGRDRLTRRGDA